MRVKMDSVHMKQLLAYLHPAIQALVLLIALATLRLGLALKKHRTRQRHLQERRHIFARRAQRSAGVTRK